jgi:endoglucanase
MDRREFSRLGAAVVLGPPVLLLSGTASGAPQAKPGAGPVAMGTNLSGMEWAKPGLRYGASSLPNVHFTVPRKADVAYLAACGYTKNRLPIQWELLQPMLHDTIANETAKKLIGNPGAFHAAYEAYITGVLDAHAAAGSRCIIDNHNYCRYQDFKFQTDGSVPGLTPAPQPLMRPYTTDASQVQIRIFSLAEGATLKQSHFIDFWSRAAMRWKDHPGFGGYGLMNEPHQMPASGSVVGTKEKPGSGEEDLRIWPAYAQAAIDAIRKIDTINPIYVAGNEWSAAMSMGTKNPGFPLKGANLIYEVHLYLDARNTGAAFDYETEAASDFTAGLGRGGIKPSTGFDRLKAATQWAKEKGVKVALTEIGMPIDDVRWQLMFARTVNHAIESGCEVYTWMGGNHWPIRNYAINHVPGWHQNKTLEPLVSGPLKAAAGRAQAALFDDGPVGLGSAPAGTPLAVTVYARGNLAAPLSISVASSGAGKLDKTRLSIPAGANGQDTFTYTPAANEVATLRYTLAGAPAGQGAMTAPPARQIYSLTDPVAHAAKNLPEAALAIMARYAASKWDLADGYTDYVLGAPAKPGDVVRAVSDSGFGSSPGNAMEMLNAINKDSPAMGTMALPVMRVTKGRKNADCSADNLFGLWCKKSAIMPGIQPMPKNRVPYNIEDAHFAMAVVSIPGAPNTGVVFQASKTEELYTSELGFDKGQPLARWIDAKGQTVQLVSPERLPPDAPAVLALISSTGRQKLRVNSREIASGNATFAASACTQMLIGWGYLSYYPQAGFGGHVYAVIAGKGAPTADELTVLERYLASIAGVTRA